MISLLKVRMFLTLLISAVFAQVVLAQETHSTVFDLGHHQQNPQSILLLDSTYYIMGNALEKKPELLERNAFVAEVDLDYKLLHSHIHEDDNSNITLNSYCRTISHLNNQLYMLYTENSTNDVNDVDAFDFILSYDLDTKETVFHHVVKDSFYNNTPLFATDLLANDENELVGLFVFGYEEDWHGPLLQIVDSENANTVKNQFSYRLHLIAYSPRNF